MVAVALWGNKKWRIHGAHSHSISARARLEWFMPLSIHYTTAGGGSGSRGAAAINITMASQGGIKQKLTAISYFNFLRPRRSLLFRRCAPPPMRRRRRHRCNIHGVRNRRQSEIRGLFTFTAHSIFLTRFYFKNHRKKKQKKYYYKKYMMGIII